MKLFLKNQSAFKAIFPLKIIKGISNLINAVLGHANNHSLGDHMIKKIVLVITFLGILPAQGMITGLALASYAISHSSLAQKPPLLIFNPCPDLPAEYFYLKDLCTEDQIEIISKKEQKHLFAPLINSLSDEKIIKFIEEIYKKNKDLKMLWFWWDKNFPNTIKKIGEVLAKKAPSIIRHTFAFDFLFQLSSEDSLKWLEDFEQEKCNPFLKHQSIGPVFLDYNKDDSQRLIRLVSPSIFPHFNELLPDILDHIAHEYDQNRIVLIHGQSHFWIFLEQIYHTLYNATHEKKAPENFVHLRFKEHSTLTDTELLKIQKQGGKTWENLLFTNLILFKKNDRSRDSWLFAATGYDATTSERGECDWIKYIENMFENMGMKNAYEHAITQNPSLFKELKSMFDRAIKEQGSHGRLIILSMTKEIAQASVYSADQFGKKITYPIKSFLFKKTLISNPVEGAKYIAQLPFDQEWCVALKEEFINPEAAENACIKIIGFDPVVYKKTEKYKLLKTKIEKTITDIKRIHDSQ